jgi:hypothetical protein
MRHRGVLDLDAELFGKLLKFARGEVGAVVGDDIVRYAVPVDDGLEELDRCGRLLIGDTDNFDPFGELVDGDQQVSVASLRRFGQRPYFIEPPLREGLGGGYGVQF